MCAPNIHCDVAVENKAELGFRYVVGDVHFTVHMDPEQLCLLLCHWLTGGQEASLVPGEPATAPLVQMSLSHTAPEMRLVEPAILSLGNDSVCICMGTCVQSHEPVLPDTGSSIIS